MLPWQTKHIVSHYLPPDVATQFNYFTLLPRTMPPNVDKKTHVHLYILQKLDFISKLDESSGAGNCFVLQLNTQ